MAQLQNLRMKKLFKTISLSSINKSIFFFINDSDIYEFYLKYRNNVDEVLSDSDFFEEKPSDLESFSLYDYLIVGTKKAVKSFIEMLNKA